MVVLGIRRCLFIKGKVVSIGIFEKLHPHVHEEEIYEDN
jgi:hypothetical protein